MTTLYTLSGRVIEGKRIGTELGYPTANLPAPDDSPKGVFIAACEAPSGKYIAIVNSGNHPTFPEGAPTVEAHLLDYSGGDMYGQYITLKYLSYLRAETTFQGGAALSEQLKSDKLAARRFSDENAGIAEEVFMDAKPLIELDNVFYTYEDGEKNAVDGVTISVPKGQFIAILGHNGSGKSTLAKLMNALFQPTGGNVTVCGMDAAKTENVWDIRKHAGMVFQNPDNQIVASVVREDVAFGLENMGVPQPEMIERIDTALSDVRMTEFAASAPHMLSGGQKQRVAIAGVLAMAPDVMILDEATSMLDPSGRSEVISIVKRLNRERGITVVWITHFMEEAALADRVVVLDKGKVAMDGEPREVFSETDALQALGLDAPPMALLARDLTEKGLTLPKGILTVPEMVKELKLALCR